MEKQNLISNRRLLTFSAWIGAGDFITGILLLADPLGTLEMMQVKSLPIDVVYLQFVGVFVGVVGALYFLPYFVQAQKQECCLHTVWLATAIIRTAVGSFVSYQIYRGVFEIAWFSVALTDFFFAILQLYLLRRGNCAV